MKTFKKLLSEVAEPQAGDEINFKKKHIIQRFYDPAGNDDAFTGNVSTEWDMINGKRFYNHADYKDGEDEDVYESKQLDEVSDKKLKTYMKAASDIAAKSDDEKTVAKRTNGVLKASEKIKEAHSHPLYDMHGLEDEDINNDGVVDEKDAAMKRARDLLIKKRYYLEDVASDDTHIINHNSKAQYRKLNAITAAKYKLDPEKIVKESEQLDEISINLKQKYYDKSNAAKRAAGYGYSHKNDDGTLKSDEEGKRAFTRMKSMNKVQDELKWHKNPVQANVHDLTHMKHDGDVYDHTQTSEKMKDGDVMKLHGGRAAVLVGAWPVITHGDSDILHKVKEGSHITKLDKGRYKKSFEVASKHATAPELKESTELNELSRKTLSSYSKKAATDLAYKGLSDSMKKSIDGGERDKKITARKVMNRMSGVHKAVDKLAEDGAAYAIGMSKAKEIHNDEPPLRKKTIKTAHKIAKAIIGESDESCNCYHIAGSEDSHHIENLKSLAPNSKIADGIAKVSRTNEEAIAYMDEHFPSLHEDIDQLDEISNEMKAKYLDKAVQQRYDFFTGGRNTPTQKRRKPASHYEQPEIKKALAKDAKRGEIIDKTAKALTGTPHYSKMSTSTSPAVHGNADSWWRGKKYTTEGAEQIDEAMKLDSVNIVHHDEASADFAKKYVKAHKGDHRPSGPTAADERAQDQFYTDHGYKHIRHGFGGSGETHYKDGKTGHIYSVRRVANGKGFHGTDHHITKLNEDVDQLDETFSAGSLKLSDGSSVTVSAQDAKLLNQMFNDLNSANKKKMEKVLMTDKHGFQEILGFAREAL